MSSKMTVLDPNTRNLFGKIRNFERFFSLFKNQNFFQYAFDTVYSSLALQTAVLRVRTGSEILTVKKSLDTNLEIVILM